MEGTGLGLALSKQLVELMGGSIGVDTTEGTGSTFWVELAVATSPAEAVAERVPEEGEPERPPAGGTRRVLLIEDNLANLKLIEALVQDRAGMELLPAMTGRLGVELAREHQPDLDPAGPASPGHPRRGSAPAAQGDPGNPGDPHRDRERRRDPRTAPEDARDRCDRVRDEADRRRSVPRALGSTARTEEQIELRCLHRSPATSSPPSIAARTSIKPRWD